MSKIAENPVKLDWVPPDVTPDLVSDYMDQLGHENIPVSGSEAASQRKKRLEFQVPPHDLDAALCHNLTEKETEQLQKYVESIRENCVGQGNVIRLGEKQRGIVGYVGGSNTTGTGNEYDDDDDLPPPPSPIVDKNPFQTNHCLIEELFNPDGSLQVQLQPDKLLSTILHSDMVRSIRELPMSATERATVSSTLPEMVPDFIISPHLKPASKDKLRGMKINTTGIRSAVLNGPIYDRLFKDLRDRNINFADDPVLGPLSKFRDNYRTDEPFRQDADNFVRHLDPNYDEYVEMPSNGNVMLKGIATPLRQLATPSQFYSPVNARQRVPGARESSLLTQETPMRKLRFPSSFNQLYDPVYPQIASIIDDPSRLVPGTAVVIHEKPLVADFPKHCKLTTPTKEKLGVMGLNSDAVRSGVINGPQYDKLFRDLRGNRIRFGEDKLLGPMEAFRDEYLADPELRNETNQFTMDTAEELPETLVASKSNDSGFDSVPPTPNYGSYPGRMAQQGAFAQIPGIEDLNMYPEVMPPKGTAMAPLINQMAGLKGPSSVQGPGGECSAATTDVTSLNINCKQCEKDIRLGEVVVKAQRAGKDVAWHPQCFVCHKCNELLADLVYFFHGGNVYCARDLAETLKIPRCKACDELIFTNEYTAAEMSTFHIKHFCCYQCDTPLAGQKYIPDEKTNMPMCLTCFNEYHAEKCRRCKKVIGPTEQGVSWKDLHWHGACFLCAGQGCGKSLIGSRFCVKNEMTFCSADCVNSVING